MAQRILGLEQHVRRLEGLLPICMYCEKISDEGQAWTPIERYVRDRSRAEFSHGIWPEGTETRVRPELAPFKQEAGGSGGTTP